jgi:hypothetical protein
MLKNIGERYEHQGAIKVCKQISAWLHNHSQLHAMMKNAIDGELVKWNATRFGTNYMHLLSSDKKDKRTLKKVDFLTLAFQVWSGGTD